MAFECFIYHLELKRIDGAARSLPRIRSDWKDRRCHGRLLLERTKRYKWWSCRPGYVQIECSNKNVKVSGIHIEVRSVCPRVLLWPRSFISDTRLLTRKIWKCETVRDIILHSHASKGNNFKVEMCGWCLGQRFQYCNIFVISKNW